MVATVLQTGGFVLGLIGMAGVFAATVEDKWCDKDRQGDMVICVYTYRGLWWNCEVPTTGFTECQSLSDLQGFSGLFKAVRALMIVAIEISVIAVLIGLFSLRCLKMRSMVKSTKTKMTLSSGIIFFIAGICSISGASVYANQIEASFMMTTYNQNQGKLGVKCQCVDGLGFSMIRYIFGPILFIAWVGGALLLLEGILMCIAVKGIQNNNNMGQGHVYEAPAQCREDDEECHLKRMDGEQKC
ncbi:claudin-18 [Myxocyprinus asiaticus]|uniref:claudin-18 n=1 Tax=Myxocyprinus asiaticus TaxID=70543 RepID=UPI002223DDFD|nr:claudin-18 [Myxocyprinus asiaticus]